MSRQRILAIIPARGGSRGISRKNLQLLGGKPLIAWPIELAKSIAAIDRVIVSSDDDEIISTARKYGAEVLFKRPDYLSRNNTPTLPVLQHTIKFLQKNENYKSDIVLLLYSTTPFLKRERVIEGIGFLRKGDVESIVGVRKVRGLLWKVNKKNKLYPFYPKMRVNRQYFNQLYEEAGNIYFNKTNVLLRGMIVNPRRCQPIFVEPEEMLDIDTFEDLQRARNLLKHI